MNTAQCSESIANAERCDMNVMQTSSLRVWFWGVSVAKVMSCRHTALKTLTRMKGKADTGGILTRVREAMYQLHVSDDLID